MRTIATKCLLGDLKPGEMYLFDQDGTKEHDGGPGFLVWIRKDEPLMPGRQNDVAYRITIEE